MTKGQRETERRRSRESRKEREIVNERGRERERDDQRDVKRQRDSGADRCRVGSSTSKSQLVLPTVRDQAPVYIGWLCRLFVYSLIIACFCRLSSHLKLFFLRSSYWLIVSQAKRAIRIVILVQSCSLDLVLCRPRPNCNKRLRN